LNFLATTLRKALATLLLWVGCMGCVLPQDDEVIVERPPFANRPLRVVSGSARPAQRESVVQLGPNCPREDFSIRVSDPDLDDTIAATWFIDPNERYVASPNSPVLTGNPGSRLSGSDLRIVTSPSVLRTTLQQYIDGQKHRIEVVVTDGRFIESELIDQATMEARPFLDVSRDPIRNQEGVFAVEAFRDEYVWLVEVSNAPCP
jgi:hypothetical protein